MPFHPTNRCFWGVFTCSSYTSTGGPCKEQLAIEEERISEKYAQEEAEAQGNLSKNAVVNSFGDCLKWIATATFSARLFLTRQQRIWGKRVKNPDVEKMRLWWMNLRDTYLVPTSWVGGVGEVRSCFNHPTGARKSYNRSKGRGICERNVSKRSGRLVRAKKEKGQNFHGS